MSVCPTVAAPRRRTNSLFLRSSHPFPIAVRHLRQRTHCSSFATVTFSLLCAHPFFKRASQYLIEYMAAPGEIGVSEFLQGTCRQTLFLAKKPEKHRSQLLWGTLCNRGRVSTRSTRKSLRLRCQAQENPRVVVTGSVAGSVEQQSGLIEKPSAEVIHLYRVPFIQESAAAEILKEAQAKISNQIVDLKTEQCFNVGLGSQLS
ncbi:phosphoribosylformylglycinamidine synthase, partial [Trifolium pratense]